MGRRVLLIHNPAAARSYPRRLAAARSTLEREGCAVQVAETRGPGDAVELARLGVREGVDVVAVYGGDGTMMQAVEGMIGEGVPLGLIPGGTGNLLASNLGIPWNPRRAAQTIARGCVRAIDLGRLESDGRVRYFAVASGAGYDADIMSGTTGPAKRRWGMTAYVARVIRTLGAISPAPYRLVVDGETHEVEAVTVVVANCNQIVPPWLKLGRRVAPDDGLLDVVVLNAGGLLDAASVVWQLVRQAPDSDGVRRFRAREVVVDARPARPVQLDGEPNGATPFTATILPGALHVLVPET